MKLDIGRALALYKMSPELLIGLDSARVCSCLYITVCEGETSLAAQSDNGIAAE